MAIENLELAVVKSLSEAPLSLDEALELAEAQSGELMEMGLTIGEVNNVRNWFKHEAMRHIAQSQLQPALYQEGRARKIGSAELRSLIREENRRLRRRH